jgi:hypothetical protein
MTISPVVYLRHTGSPRTTSHPRQKRQQAAAIPIPSAEMAHKYGLNTRLLKIHETLSSE